MSKPRFLCLHGFRTSADIFEFQLSAFREATSIEFVFIDAPFKAEGPPDPLISAYFPGYDLFEWHPSESEHFGFGDDDEDTSSQTEERKALILGTTEQSERYIIDKYRELGPFNGLVGFSQGGQMATRVAHKLGSSFVKSVILFSSVVAVNLEEKNVILDIPSLHIISEQDKYCNYCRRLLNIYSESSRTALYHDEGHKIPSAQTKLYPVIQAWISKNSGQSRGERAPGRMDRDSNTQKNDKTVSFTFCSCCLK